MSKQYPKTKSEIFNAYSNCQFEVPYISVGDVKKAFEEFLDTVEESKHKYRGNGYSRQTREYCGTDYLAYE